MEDPYSSIGAMPSYLRKNMSKVSKTHSKAKKEDKENCASGELKE